MTVEEKKERNRKYGAICARAKAISIQSTGNGGISWSYSTSYIRVADGVIVGYWT